LTGTARGQAMGGAFGALGGDITGVAINPAGISIYRSSELSTTLSLNSTNIKTQWGNSVNNNDKLKFNFNNISYIGYYPVGGDQLQSVNFGFSYNKIKNFNRNYSASGKGMKTSLTDYIENITYDKNMDDLKSSNAYDISGIPWLSLLGIDGAVLVESGDKIKYSSCLDVKELVDPRLNVTEKGYIDSYNFTIGTNFSNSLYLGLTVSLTDIYYRMDSHYGEEFGKGESYILKNFLQTEGSGYQVNFGAIWHPVDFLRVGVAYHSPTWLVLKDFYQGTLDSDLKINGQRVSLAYTPDDNFDYRFRSPSNWVFSAAGILGRKAVVNIDYELKDYRSMNFADQYSSAYNSFAKQNEDINKKFKVASTLRAGLEYRFTPQFSGRLGYAQIEHPYEKDFKENKVEVITAGTIPHYTIEGDINYFTTGLGYRFTPNFYIDAAFIYRTQTDNLYFFPYVETNRPGDTNEPVPYFPQGASFTNTSYKGLVTLGYKF
jgi:long-subunit fatty acid transport protein